MIEGGWGLKQKMCLIGMAQANGDALGDARAPGYSLGLNTARQFTPARATAAQL